jgi:AraC-like DNA-binding protein/ligand-binding sensor protein
MDRVAFEVLAHSCIVQDFLREFRAATGQWIQFLPVGATLDEASSLPVPHPLCARLALQKIPGQRCSRTCDSICRRAEAMQTPVAGHCLAGLSVVAVPVALGRTQVGTLLAGCVFYQKPSPETLEKLANRWRAAKLQRQWPAVRRAYLRTTVISAARFRAQTHLLKFFAQYLGEFASRYLLQDDPHIPLCVRAAVEFTRQHLSEPLTMRDAARHAHLSPAHFCRMFHKATGLTFSEYVARQRADKAKELLADPAVRVTEVAFAAGFQSLSQFNAVFKKHTGCTPTDYRRRMGEQYVI